MALVLVANVSAAESLIIYFDTCGTYGLVEYIETTHGSRVKRDYMSIDTGSPLGSKIWKDGQLAKDTLGQTCQNDL